MKNTRAQSVEKLGCRIIRNRISRQTEGEFVQLLHKFSREKIGTMDNGTYQSGEMQYGAGYCKATVNRRPRDCNVGPHLFI